MDLTIIEEEIYKFNKDFFNDISKVTEESLDFIKQNNLHIPKENYTVVGSFLSATIQNFRVLDSAFMSSTLKKIDEDIKNLQIIHEDALNITNNPKEVFDEKFVKSSISLSTFAKEILKTEDASERKNLSSMFKELKAIYYDPFQELFNDDKKYLISSLMKVLNSRTYYFDKLLWKETSQSNVITKHLQALKINNSLNTKDYLLHTTGLMRPYTKEYQYLQSCLRIYK